MPQALNDLQKARDYCTDLGGTSLGSQLDGQTLGDGAYQVSGDAALGSGANLTLTGDTATVIVLNVTGSLELGAQARVILSGVLPEHVFWNVGGDLLAEDYACLAGVALVGGTTRLTGTQFGQHALLSVGTIYLTDLSAMVGHNKFTAPSNRGINCSPTACNSFVGPVGELIRNGSLEVKKCCPIELGGLDDPSDACFWSSATWGSSDYFNSCQPNSPAGVPTNTLTSTSPTSSQGSLPVLALAQNSTATNGTAYAGAYAYAILSSNGASYREYLYQEVPSGLLPGHRYYAGFWAHLAPYSNYSVPKLGMLVGLASLPYPSQASFAPIVATPNISGNPRYNLTAPQNDLANLGWQRVGGVFEADAGFAGSNSCKVIIGNFGDDNQNYDDGPSTGGLPMAYYYYDNITLSMVTEAGSPVTLNSACPGGNGPTSTTLGTLPMPAIVGATYAWTASPADPTLTPTTANPTVSPTQTTTYTLTVTIPGELQTYSSTVTVSIVPGTTGVTFNWTQTGCRSIVATPAVTVPGATYIWSWGENGPGTAGGSGPAPHTYTSMGSSYQVTLQVLVPGCNSGSSTQTVTLAPPPATPAFTVQADCSGLATNTLTNPAAGVTYSWSWSDDNSTLTGPGPYPHQYAASGTYTVTVTATNSVGCAVSASQPVTVELGACCPRNIAAENRLGQPGQLTTLSGGATYAGTYWVRGDLLLTYGDYELTPGTIFYVDGVAYRQPTAGPVDERDVKGYRITLGNGARLIVDGATITASGSSGCAMWRGLVVDGYLREGSPTQVIIRNGGVISHAYCALTITDRSTTANGVAYSLTDSNFLHNLTHVLDMGIRKRGRSPGYPGGAALIQHCTFDADPLQMHFPYNATTPSDQYVTYQALQLLPYNDPGSDADAVEVTGNTIRHALYGIVNNVPNSLETHDVLIQGNYLTDIYQLGIWAVDNQALPQPGTGAGVGEVSGNVVALSDWGGLVTEQLAATNLRIGLSNESNQGGFNPAAAFRDNKVYGQPGGTRPQLGLNLRYQVAASGNTLTNLEEGIRTAALSQARLYDNHTTDCVSGVTVQPSGNYGYDAQIGCNTFERDQAGGLLRGIYAVTGADFNDQGSQNQPAGNAFLGMDEEVRHEGNPANPSPGFIYYRTGSLQEDVRRIYGGASGTPITSGVLFTNYCGGPGTNGVNRGMAPSPTYIAALADTVRRQLVPRARRRACLNEVLHYYVEQGQLTDLEAWWATLLPGNAEDYRTTGLSLLAAYDQQPATAADAQRVLTGLQPQAQLDADLAAELALRQVERHLPRTVPVLTAADSTALRGLAWSGTVVAGRAGRWLRYFHPRAELPTVSPDPWRTAARSAVAAPSAKAALAAQLGEAYPNPAHTEVQVACQLSAGAAGGTLRFTDLVTGRTVLEVAVPSGEQAAPVRVALDKLAAGAYAYRLLVDGRPVAGARKLVVIP